MLSCDYLHSMMRSDEKNYSVESRHLLSSRKTLTMLCCLIFQNVSNLLGGVFVKMYNPHKFQILVEMNVFIIIQSKSKRRERKSRVTSFSFFNDPFHNFELFFFFSYTNFSFSVCIHVTITPSSPLSCHFQLFVVKMTYLLLPHPTSEC